MKVSKDMWVFKLCWTLGYFSFNNYLLCFNFSICFISFCSCLFRSSAVGIKIYAITAGIKEHKSIIKKKKKKRDKIVLLGKDKINITKFLISKALRNSYINHYEFVSVNNVLREIKTSV